MRLSCAGCVGISARDERGLQIIPLHVRDCETPLALHDLQRIDARDGKYPACLPELLHALGMDLDQKLDEKSNNLPVSSVVADTQDGDILRGI